MTVIQCDSQEKSSHTDNKPKSRERKIVEKLITRILVYRLYIDYTTDIESNLDASYDPKYRSMYTIHKDQEKYIHQRKVEHTPSIEKLTQNARKSYPFAATQFSPVCISTRIGGIRDSWFVNRQSEIGVLESRFSLICTVHSALCTCITFSIDSRTIFSQISTSSFGISKTSSSCTWRIIEPLRLFSRTFASISSMAILSISAAVHCMGILIASLSAIERAILLASLSPGIYRLRPKAVSTYPSVRPSSSIDS